MNQQELDAVQRAFDSTITKLSDRYRAEVLELRRECAEQRTIINALKAQPAVAGKDGKAGRDGTSINPDDVRAMVRDAVALIPKARDGIDGASVTVVDVMPAIVARIDAKLAAIPLPENGAKGKDGRDGVSVTVAEVLPLIERAVASEVAKIPAAESGRHGTNGKDGRDGTSVSVEDLIPLIERSVVAHVAKVQAPPGTPGKDGRDGASVTAVDVAPMIERSISGQIAKLNLQNGKDGVNGKDGKNGTSVTLDDIEPRIERAALALVAKIPAPAPGINGKDGKNGADGASVTLADVTPLVERAARAEVGRLPVAEPGRPGKDGIDGTNVTLTDVLPLVERTVRAEVAKVPLPKDGRDGRNGRDGEHGRDAFQLDVLPTIDTAKTYQRGAIASHLGGLFRCDSNGQWQCIVNGVKDVKTIQIDERTFEVRYVFSNGEEAHAQLKIESLLYKEVWDEATEYQRGDCVTQDGSMWVALRATKTRPGESKDWRLAVKRGRNGRTPPEGGPH